MEAEPSNLEQMTLMNFSHKQHGFESLNSVMGSLTLNTNQPTALDEQGLLSRLRDSQKRNSTTIPLTIYAFYDKC